MPSQTAAEDQGIHAQNLANQQYNLVGNQATTPGTGTRENQNRRGTSQGAGSKVASAMQGTPTPGSVPWGGGAPPMDMPTSTVPQMPGGGMPMPSPTPVPSPTMAWTAQQAAQARAAAQQNAAAPTGSPAQWNSPVPVGGQSASSGQGSPWQHNAIAALYVGAGKPYGTYDAAIQGLNGGPGAPAPDMGGGGHGGGGHHPGVPGGATPNDLAQALAAVTRFKGGQIFDMPGNVQQILMQNGKGQVFSQILQMLGFRPSGTVGPGGFEISWFAPTDFQMTPDVMAMLGSLQPDDAQTLGTLLGNLFGVGQPPAQPPQPNVPQVQDQNGNPLASTLPVQPQVPTQPKGP